MNEEIQEFQPIITIRIGESVKKKPPKQIAEWILCVKLR